MEKFKLFSINVSKAPHSIDTVIIGAESVEDLKEHWKNIDFSKTTAELPIKYDEEFVYEIKNAFTDTPYIVLDETAYYE